MQVLRWCVQLKAVSALPTLTGGRNIRLKGAIYEQSLTLAKDLEQQSKAQQKSTGEMLKAAFSEHEQSVRAELNASARRISDAISAHEQSMSEAMEKTGGACC